MCDCIFGCIHRNNNFFLFMIMTYTTPNATPNPLTCLWFTSPPPLSYSNSLAK